MRKILALLILSGLVVMALSLAATGLLKQGKPNLAGNVLASNEAAALIRSTPTHSPTATLLVMDTSTPLVTDAPTVTPTDTLTATPTNTTSPTLAPTFAPTRAPFRPPTATLRPTARPALPTPTPVPVYQLDGPSQRVFELTNAERAKSGLPPLRLNPNLIASAGWFGQDQASHHVKVLSHTDSLGRDAPTRISAFGYHWVYFGENLALGYPSADAAVAGWMASPGHHANIMNPNFTEIGIGHAVADGQDYWVQDFGSR